ncbi:glycoside hydrolase family 43 protein [Sphingobacterium bovistauri]|uniref:Glycoside hydrolase 43 family protein n=1 Tax=Sphingobacterium bovistauri TaxID=2781959 RepID=A0ABS7Z3M5_9SPHI|nr:glycoside hydrolase 43 family protein [Sphingobacterium bovistauri]MCA5004778.1 glycoside hydrolase 43 family protein [Sphingobacterium bovistauri]
MIRSVFKVLAPVVCIFLATEVYGQSSYISSVWQPELANGKYKNPILYSDYSDPDVCRVGDDFYMTASSFNAVPGLPILHSKDMIHWEIINHAIPRLEASEGIPIDFFNKAQHGNGVWAPSIRHHNGEFYIYYGDPDFGIFMTKTKDPRGNWEPLVLVKAGKGLIDACPFWDDDGNVYLAHAYAGSRAGIKSLIAVSRLTTDGKKAVGTSKIIYDGHELDKTIEGPKFYKRNGYYYIFCPAGGVATGWQTILRSKDVFGPYERKVVLAQEDTDVNGPHQGAWVNSPDGKDWFYHFQDVGVVGRIVHLQPMKWSNDWPVIGEDKGQDGIGRPVKSHAKPIANTVKKHPQESDEFNTNALGLQWQWHGNPEDWWHYTNVNSGVLSLYSVAIPQSYKNLFDVPNLLLQKIPAPEFVATTKLDFKPNPQAKKERSGLVIMGMDYAVLAVEYESGNYKLAQIECYGAEKGKQELVNESVALQNGQIYLQVKYIKDNTCQFYYSLDGKDFKLLGKSFKAREGKWIGAKVGVFCSRSFPLNDGGQADIDWFRMSK